MPTQSDVDPSNRVGPWSAPRDPRSYPSARRALLVDHQQDWVYAQAQYEANIKSVPLIAKEIGVGPTAIYARASTHGWTRNLEARAQLDIELRIAAEAETAKAVSVERERATRVNAEMQARVLVTHRHDIGRAREITQRLWEQVQDILDSQPALEALGQALRDENARGQDRENDAYHAVIALPGLVDMVKKLSDAQKTQFQLERQAFGIVGALEDPEVTVPTGVGTSDIDKILGKFDLVLKSKSPGVSGSTSGGSMPVLGEIIDA